MRPVFYDLHIHSCLSPCGDADMTVNNILNMSLLKELEMIALTDHNTCRNCLALMQAAEGTGLVVVPGMELSTAEEVHMVCLFPALENAMAFDRYVYDCLPPFANCPQIFGEQTILDAEDQPVGTLEKLLVNATSIGISSLPSLMQEYGGLCFPAHIDRGSYSVLSNLGALPPECGFRAVEVADPARFFADGQHAEIREQYTVVVSSDAHYLENISERDHCIHLETTDFHGLAGRML